MAYRVGIDIGSTATKACVLEGESIACTAVLPTGYSSVDAAARVLDHLDAQGYPAEQCVFAATGYGRVAVPFARKTITEITCHGKGAARLFGDDCTVVDIGGQDTKAIVIKDGKVTDFRMNDKCSAGTGKFLEVMANRLGLSQEQLCDLARQGQPTSISSMCTVFAESEVISLIGSGTPREDICWGIVESVVRKVAPLVPKSAAGSFVLTGGLCDNAYVVERLSGQLGSPVQTQPLARFAGALGAALCLPEDARPQVAVFTFGTITEALAFEKLCKDEGLEGRIVPLPDSISAGCGYAWQAPLHVRGQLEQRAADAGCAYEAVFEKEYTHGRSAI